jgi:hypothetical protein
MKEEKTMDKTAQPVKEILDIWNKPANELHEAYGLYECEDGFQFIIAFSDHTIETWNNMPKGLLSKVNWAMCYTTATYGRFEGDEAEYPCIVFPERNRTKLSDEERYQLLLHEIGHLKLRHPYLGKKYVLNQEIEADTHVTDPDVMIGFLKRMQEAAVKSKVLKKMFEDEGFKLQSYLDDSESDVAIRIQKLQERIK